MITVTGRKRKLDTDLKIQEAAVEPHLIWLRAHRSLSHGICCKITYLLISCPLFISPLFNIRLRWEQTQSWRHCRRQDMTPDTRQILKFATLKRAEHAWKTHRWGLYGVGTLKLYQNWGYRELCGAEPSVHPQYLQQKITISLSRCLSGSLVWPRWMPGCKIISSAAKATKPHNCVPTPSHSWQFSFWP